MRVQHPILIITGGMTHTSETPWTKRRRESRSQKRIKLRSYDPGLCTIQVTKRFGCSATCFSEFNGESDSFGNCTWTCKRWKIKRTWRWKCKRYILQKMEVSIWYRMAKLEIVDDPSKGFQQKSFKKYFSSMKKTQRKYTTLKLHLQGFPQQIFLFCHLLPAVYVYVYVTHATKSAFECM